MSSEDENFTSNLKQVGVQKTSLGIIIYVPTPRPTQKREKAQCELVERLEGAYRVPKSQLPLAHAAEPSGEDIAISQKDGSHGSCSFVRFLLLLQERAKRCIAHIPTAERRVRCEGRGPHTQPNRTPHTIDVYWYVCVSVITTSPPHTRKQSDTKWFGQGPQHVSKCQDLNQYLPPGPTANPSPCTAKTEHMRGLCQMLFSRD